jgi:phospholipid/cholesterol/gamma-HCH transport system substrate-binding protein
VGASKYFETGDLYVSYFDESVQGLDRDSEVKYRGVKVGRVVSIGIAPDSRHIAVTMSINLKDDLSTKVVAQLQLTGITGILFVNLERQRPKDPLLCPALDFPAPHPIIPTRASDLKTIITGVEAIIAELQEVDTQGISDQVKKTFQEIEKFFQSKNLQTTLANLEATSANLKSLSHRLDKLAASGKVEQVLQEAREALKGSRELFATVKQELQAAKLPEIGGKTRRLLTEVEAASEHLKRTSESLELLAERLYERPSDLLFGKPPPKRWNE